MVTSFLCEVKIELSQFGIRDDGTMSQETSAGLNRFFQYAKEQGFNRIIFPKGTYLIHETSPVVIDLKNVVIDLNGSTLQLNSNGLERYSIVEFRKGAENVRLTNGIIRGDKDTHDYETVKGTHEWGTGLSIKTGNNLQIDHITATNVTGYGIAIESGTPDFSRRYYPLYTKDVVPGAIADDGSLIDSNTTTRSIAYDLTVCGGQFELGYSLGYIGYPYLLKREYTAYFYDESNDFIQKKECLQYRKVDIPEGTKYARFVYPQANITSNLNLYGWITNLQPPTNCRLSECLIKGNRCLGLAVCGGHKWIVEDNVFEENGGRAANHAIDIEDGFEMIQDYIFRNNRFINNTHDVTVFAGDNLVFEANHFTKSFNVNGRTTNYKVIGNKFDNNERVAYRVRLTECEVRNNQYINTNIVTDRDIADSPLIVTLMDETLDNVQINAGSGKGARLVNCDISSTLKSTLKLFYCNATFENCTIDMTRGIEAFNLVLIDCNLKNISQWNLYETVDFRNCKINNIIFTTFNKPVKTKFINSDVTNCQVLYSTWGAVAETVFENCQVTINTNRPLVRLSAGKTGNLLFKNNTVVNQAAKPVFELYDTTYSVPNGNATLEDNSFAQSNYGFIFDGVNITKGIFNFTDKNNVAAGAQILNPKYVGNPFFVINR